MAKKVRIHLTAAQEARLNPAKIETADEIARSTEKDLAVTSSPETAPPSEIDPSNPEDLPAVASELDLIGSGASRPTAVIRIL